MVRLTRVMFSFAFFVGFRDSVILFLAKVLVDSVPVFVDLFGLFGSFRRLSLFLGLLFHLDQLFVQLGELLDFRILEL
jgi:hypothetical protein